LLLESQSSPSFALKAARRMGAPADASKAQSTMFGALAYQKKI